MKCIKYLLFLLICLFSCSIVFAENEVVIKSITPIYDENSSVVVTEEDNSHNVTFNDKNQNVKYNVVIENTTDDDLKVEEIKLTGKSEEFLKYTLEGLSTDEVLKSNETKELVVSLETIQIDGWGRNFDDELIANVSFDNIGKGLSNIINPNTGAKGAITLLIFFIVMLGITIAICSKTKSIRYIILILTLSSTLTIANAEDSIVLPIKINVNFESQNVMKKLYTDFSWSYGEPTAIDYLEYRERIKNVYIENEMREIADYVYKYDVSEEGNDRVNAYLVKNQSDVCGKMPDGSSIDCYDLYIIADGKIYANSDASFYFYMVKLEMIDNLKGLETSNVTNMSFMFRGIANETSNYTIDLSNFDTSNVTDMSYMFYNTGSKNSNFTLDVSNFDTSKVTNMSSMFGGTGYSNPNFTLDLSNFDTSNVTDMSYMFEGTGYNSKVFTLDVSNFDTSKVTDMSSMFKNAGYSNPNFTLDVSNFDTSNVKYMWDMFNGTGYNSTKFITSITIKNPKTTSYSTMFRDVATKNGSKITVNYTSETSALVDKMITTKSSNSNVVKGTLVE